MLHVWTLIFPVILLAPPGGDGVESSSTAGGLPPGIAESRPASQERVAVSLEALRGRCPEWLEILVAILGGQGMEEGKGWWHPSATVYSWTWLRERFDANRDARIDPGEVPDLRERFNRLDRNEDGFLTREDLEGPEPPEPQPLVRGLFRRFDTDGNDRVSWDELSWFFQQADRRKRGFISRRDLSASLADLLTETKEGAAARGQGATKESEESLSRWGLLKVFLKGQLGSFGEGPALGTEAPDFSLPCVGRGERVRLREATAKRPVVLIFGSFT